MAYNLQPLITILQQILDPQQTLFFFRNNKPQLQSLLNKVASLQRILENSSIPKIETLEIQIRDAAHKAEDTIEYHVVDRMLSMSEVVSFFVLTLDVQQSTQEFDLVMKQVVKLVEVEGKKMSIGSSSLADASSVSSSKSVVVGIEEDLTQLKDRLTGTQRKLEIVPIVGMGGIGKTTLARNLYQDPLIVEHFEFLAWTTISQDYNMRAILLSLLLCITGEEFNDKHIVKGNDKSKDTETGKLTEKGDNELKDILYKSLYGGRYMIILDDIWSPKFWDEIRMYLPDNNNGSRIVITTRESDTATYVGSTSLHHQVELLSESVSWDLLSKIVFGEDDCPYILQGIGKKIVNDCAGLPLAINVIGGILSKVEKSQYVWENIGNDVSAAVVESDDQFSSILSLSYDHLPNHLKSCFLYMAAFPEDYEVKASRLIRMWVAEGFLRSNGNKSLEEEGEDCIKALVQRNLLFVRNYKYGKPDRYNMHDLLRDLCIKKAKEERFLQVKNGPEVTFSNPRRASVHTAHGLEDVFASTESMSHARSFICIGQTFDEIPFPEFSMLGLLRVLDVLQMDFDEFPREIYQLVNLRYLAIYCNSSLPAGISRLRSLQTLIAELDKIDKPSEIWQLSELQFLKVNGFVLFRNANMKNIVQKKLQVISLVRLSRSLIQNGFFKNIPNIKKLGLYDDQARASIAVDLSPLHKLETLTFESKRDGGSLFLLRAIFPSSLRKLSVVKCAICPRVLASLSALPNLEVLKIKLCKFEGDEWKAGEGDEFPSLKFLSLADLNLVHWRADETNFPNLRHLCLRSCWELQEIPSGFGEIATLQLIEMHNCSASAVDSAKQIEEGQQSDFENYDLKLRIS